MTKKEAEAFDAMREVLEQLRYCTKLSIDSIVAQGKEALAKADAARPKEKKPGLCPIINSCRVKCMPDCELRPRDPTDSAKQIYMDLTHEEFMAGISLPKKKEKKP